MFGCANRTPSPGSGKGGGVIVLTVRNHAGTMNELGRTITRLDTHLNCKIRVPVFVYIDHGACFRIDLLVCVMPSAYTLPAACSGC